MRVTTGHNKFFIHFHNMPSSKPPLIQSVSFGRLWNLFQFQLTCTIPAYEQQHMKSKTIKRCCVYRKIHFIFQTRTINQSRDVMQYAVYKCLLFSFEYSSKNRIYENKNYCDMLLCGVRCIELYVHRTVCRMLLPSKTSFILFSFSSHRRCG